jgi:hypothetical protein
VLKRALPRGRSPSTIVRVTTTQCSYIPDRDAITLHGCALVYIFYADFDAARAAVEGIDWERRTHLIRALKHSPGALLCYLEAGRHETGLEFARAAGEMGRVSAAFPRLEVGGGFLGGVCGDRASAVRGLHGRDGGEFGAEAGRLADLGKLLVARGLAVAYDRGGDGAKAEAARAFIRDGAPHCRAIASS